MDWGVVDVDRLQGLRCPSCRGVLTGGLMRLPRAMVIPPLDVDDVRHAHDLLAERDWHVSELFAAPQ